MQKEDELNQGYFIYSCQLGALFMKSNKRSCERLQMVLFIGNVGFSEYIANLRPRQYRKL